MLKTYKSVYAEECDSILEGFLFWKMPKLKVVCGKCNGLFKTRDFIEDEDFILTQCKHCGVWNEIEGEFCCLLDE